MSDANCASVDTNKGDSESSVVLLVSTSHSAPMHSYIK